MDEDPKYSRPRRVSLRDLFAPFIVTEAVEMTLSVASERQVSDATRFQWLSDGDHSHNSTMDIDQEDDLGM